MLSLPSSENPVLDLDWTATPDNQSILAVGFAHYIDLLCQQRMTYFDETPGWATCWKIDMSRFVSSFPLITGGRAHVSQAPFRTRLATRSGSRGACFLLAPANSCRCTVSSIHPSGPAPMVKTRACLSTLLDTMGRWTTTTRK